MILQISLDNASLEQLVELSNLIYDENETVEIFLVLNDNDEQATRESLIEAINEGVHDLKYDGNNDYNSMYWFVKGIKTADDQWKSLMNIGEQPLIKQLPVPHAPKHPKQPQRYDQTDEFIMQKNKRLDDELFNDIKQKPKHKDVVHEYHKHRAQTKFNYNLNKEAITIQASKANYQRMLNDLLNNKPLLRSLPPAIMKELKPYHQKIFEGENELFIDWISKFGHEFVSKADDQLLVYVPHDYDKALFLLNQHRQKYPNSEIANKKQNDEPFVVYYLNKITCLDDIFNYLDNVVFKTERKPFMLEFKLSGIFALNALTVIDFTLIQ